ncbi:hypothetical protein CDL12_17365 [Handroanthus impetiginosus]|uniref:Uncharacterized protein n=1 Tax=Handroanthus impetiginosus TaxID=429701 RepID=A0A2G9GXP7_9LAMI|nr:hypothetical protein CDL12_17365 [Handroanthus impetiginosus]
MTFMIGGSTLNVNIYYGASNFRSQCFIGLDWGSMKDSHWLGLWKYEGFTFGSASSTHKQKDDVVHFVTFLGCYGVLT